MASRSNGSATGQGLVGFLGRFEEYQHERENTHEFIKDLYMYAQNVEASLRNENTRLDQQMKDLRLDLDDATKSRRDAQQQVKDLESRLGYAPDRNPYILILIDGEGLLFKEHLVKQGVSGGRKAAKELYNAIAEKYRYAGDKQVEVLVKVVANVSVLGAAMKRDGCVGSEIELYQFVMGFNQAKASFDFVDVGYGAESPNAKIIDSMMFHLRNFNCKQILLGISHDPGYASVLDQLADDTGTKQRLTILEGCATVEELVATGITITSIRTMFRSDKLKVKASGSETPQSTTSSGKPAGASYAAMAQTTGVGPAPTVTLPIPLRKTPSSARPSKAPAPMPAPWNPGPRGLDPPIQVDATLLDRMKRKQGKEKLCNNHFLRGPCTYGDECEFLHDYIPTKKEKAVIALLARLNPCTMGQNCNVENCIYGHHCPSVVRGICTHPYCKYGPDDHPPGTKLKKYAEYN